MKTNSNELALQQDEASQCSEASNANHPGPALKPSNQEEEYYICDLTGAKIKKTW